MVPRHASSSACTALSSGTTITPGDTSALRAVPESLLRQAVSLQNKVEGSITSLGHAADKVRHDLL